MTRGVDTAPLLVGVALAVCGCNPDEFDPFNRLTGLRVLAIASDPVAPATGETTLAFAAHELGAMNLPGGYVAAHSAAQPLGMELALVTEDVVAAHATALAAGARELAPPQPKPWGQVVSYVRCPDGALVELCSPMAS